MYLHALLTLNSLQTMGFIVFNTFAQAEDYARRQSWKDDFEGCRCCGTEEYYRVDKKTRLVLNILRVHDIGYIKSYVTVIGRYKVKKA